MKVLQVGTGMSSISESTTTATEAVIYNISKELSKLAEVHILDFKDTKRKKIENISYHEIHMPNFWGPNIYTTPGTLNHIARRIFFTIKSIFKFVSLMKKENFDIIHCHNQYTGFALSLINKIFYKKCFVYTTHTPFWTLPKNKLSKLFFIKSLLERILMKNSTKVVAVSNFQKKSIENLANLDTKQLTSIPNGVDLIKFSPKKSKIREKLAPNNEKIVLCVARISKIKNQMVLIKAIPDIIKNFKVKFLFIGQIDDISYFNAISKFIKIKHLGKSVMFMQNVPNNKMPDYYRLTDMFVLPSFAEGLPLVLLEAMSSGNAIIASNIEPNKELSKNNEIVYFNPDNSRELANKILSIIKHNQIKKLGKKARKTAELFYSWKKIANEYFLLYKSLLS